MKHIEFIVPAEGKALMVHTYNSVYSIIRAPASDKLVTVFGGSFFPRDVSSGHMASYLGSMDSREQEIKWRCLDVGLSMMLLRVWDGMAVCTSPVESFGAIDIGECYVVGNGDCYGIECECTRLIPTCVHHVRVNGRGERAVQQADHITRCVPCTGKEAGHAT